MKKVDRSSTLNVPIRFPWKRVVLRDSRPMCATNTLLTLELVMAHRENIHSLDLWTYTEIEECAVAALCKLKQYLNLSGLTSLTNATAEVLSNHQGILELGGLKSLSLSAATALAKMKGGLWLDGLRR